MNNRITIPDDLAREIRRTYGHPTCRTLRQVAVAMLREIVADDAAAHGEDGE